MSLPCTGCRRRATAPAARPSNAAAPPPGDDPRVSRAWPIKPGRPHVRQGRDAAAASTRRPVRPRSDMAPSQREPRPTVCGWRLRAAAPRKPRRARGDLSSHSCASPRCTVIASSPWPLSAISKSKIAVDETKVTRNVALALPARTKATAPASSAALQPRIGQLAGHRVLCLAAPWRPVAGSCGSVISPPQGTTLHHTDHAAPSRPHVNTIERQSLRLARPLGAGAGMVTIMVATVRHWGRQAVQIPGTATFLKTCGAATVLSG